MPSLLDDETKGIEIFFFEPLKFAGEHVPRMHEDKEMPVTLDIDGAARQSMVLLKASGSQTWM
jgi:hypothetical protein